MGKRGKSKGSLLAPIIRTSKSKDLDQANLMISYEW
jgi:hypothetical protein